MRVIAGKARGRRLKTVKGWTVRPATDRIKEYMFSCLQMEIPDARILDLFAGSGSLGIEALSRDARTATFIEIDPKAIRVLRDNLTKTGLSGSVLKRDAMTFLRQDDGKYDIIFADPPYTKKLTADILKLVETHDWLGRASFLIIRHHRSEPVEPGPYFELYRKKEMSDNVIMILQKS